MPSPSFYKLLFLKNKSNKIQYERSTCFSTQFYRCTNIVYHCVTKEDAKQRFAGTVINPDEWTYLGIKVATYA
jgi:hypothetical protein